MASLQIKNLPDDLHQRLRHYAQRHNRTIREVVLTALKREVARREWHERRPHRSATELGTSAASLLEQERQEREKELA